MFYARFQGGSIDNLFTTGNGIYQTGITLNNTSATQLAGGPVFPNALTAHAGRRQRYPPPACSSWRRTCRPLTRNRATSAFNGSSRAISP